MIKKFLKKLIPKSVRQSLREMLSVFFPEDYFSFPTMPYKYTSEDAQRVYNVVLSGHLHHSCLKEVVSLEKEFAAFHKVKYALATNSGTSALESAVKAIGIKPGDEVIVPAYTFVATAQAVISRGGVPVFADIDDTYTISPKSVEEKISKRTKAILPVHLFGNVADMDSIMKIARKHNLFVIEDACQSLGASFKGRRVGAIGDIGCFSFNEKKAIATGQGGMVITSNKKFHDIMDMTRNTGQIDEELGSDVVTTGNTFSLTEMQAALARSTLTQLDELNNMRRRNYEIFLQSIDPQMRHVTWYRVLPDADASYARLVFMINFRALGISRDVFIQNCIKKGIPMKTLYPIPLYKYSLFRKRRDDMTGNTFPFDQNPHVDYRLQKLPFVEEFCKQQVAIEFSPYLRKNNIEYMVEVMKEELRAAV